MGKIYMVGAMKGGVGKSVTVFNLAYSLRKMGKKVLAVDFDPQSNLTICFGADDVDISIADLMMDVIEDEKLPGREEYVRERNGVDFIPSSIGLSAVEAKLRLEMGSERMLAAILEPLRVDYDFILIDTSPSLGTLNINAMAVADEVIVAVNPQLLAMPGQSCARPSRSRWRRPSRDRSGYSKARSRIRSRWVNPFITASLWRNMRLRVMRAGLMADWRGR